ncbi:hypothetical protein N7582_004117 [Saccharomyces uvarum]|uniref:Peptidase A1 domain-containing protein n=1 Tax=Saccharomyces uvarum TaxID=230603 RepID=A0AA35NKM7_SACUV|nr:hypothetical protein N7582_004117 [Saccharomyces uvarum]CAI4047470.1 hypothetical protein SUVC_12G4890 [Saccharomyces uvarum]
MQLFPFLSLTLLLTYFQAAFGSSSNSYVKFPVQKLANIPNSASGISKRSEAFNSTLINVFASADMYVVKMEIGTPPQTAYLQLDTGSSDMCVNEADSSYCKSLADDDNIWTSNYELTATASEISSSTTSSKASNTPCSYWGTFSPNISSTFKYNETIFDLTYGDGTYYRGTYGMDVVSLGNITLSNFTFGVSNDTTISSGILGVSLPSVEETDEIENVMSPDTTPYVYDNFPMALKRQGKIEKIAYSLFLNEPNARFGSILFGAVDKSKYSGQLYTLPMLKAYNTLDSSAGMEITAQSVAILDSKSGNKTVSEVQFPVLFDSGTSYSVLPTEIADAIGRSFDGKYSSDNQGYIFDCSKVNNTLLSIDFGGFNISANISNSVTPITKDHCLLNIEADDSGYVLGDAFLIDTYVVFDLESHEVSVAQASFNNEEEDIEIISDSVPGATPAPGYSSTWVYTPGSPIGTGDFLNVSWTSYSEFSQYKSIFATESVKDGVSSSSTSSSSSETATKKKNSGYRCRRSPFSFSLLSVLSYFLL